MNKNEVSKLVAFVLGLAWATVIAQTLWPTWTYVVCGVLIGLVIAALPTTKS
jgi:formate/nitrite transporter FocA (FNT family)